MPSSPTARRSSGAVRRAACLAAAAAGALALAVPALPALPAAAADVAPGQACSGGGWFPIEYTATYAGATGAADGVYLRRVPTTGGCASSWAHGDGQLSTAAIVAQCRTGLEARFPYPMTLRFAQPQVLTNRADCIRVMSAVAHGELDPGPAPLFPGGTR